MIMDDIFPIYFETLDTILTNEFNSIVSSEFIKKVNETRVRLKDTFIISPNYQEFCVIIDSNFDNYLKTKK